MFYPIRIENDKPKKYIKKVSKMCNKKTLRGKQLPTCYNKPSMRGFAIDRL